MYRGAVNIFISLPTKFLRNDLRRRLSLLESYFNANVILISNETDNAGSMEDFLLKCRSFGRIKAIFLMPKQTGPQNVLKYRNEVTKLDGYLRKEAPTSLLVNFCPHAVEICQSRLSNGFKSYNIQCIDEIFPSYTVKVLDKILSSNYAHTVLRSNTSGSRICIGEFYRMILILFFVT